MDKSRGTLSLKDGHDFISSLQWSNWVVALVRRLEKAGGCC